ncbi:hypothetical protein HMPREF1587_02046 [Bifidobacterium breve JCP7499]|nr:hypothetical protein HMPREF1587_02046 [Bifidobacterium breve JCP7499]
MSANILQGIASSVIERPAAKFKPRRAGPFEEELRTIIRLFRCLDVRTMTNGLYYIV